MGQRGSPVDGRRASRRSLAGAGHLQNPFTAKVIKGIERERDMTTGHGEKKEEWESVHPSVLPPAENGPGERPSERPPRFRHHHHEMRVFDSGRRRRQATEHFLRCVNRQAIFIPDFPQLSLSHTILS